MISRTDKNDGSEAMLIEPELSVPPTSIDRLQQLIDYVEVDGIYMLDTSGRVLTWNRGAELNKGYSRQEILGKHFRMFFVPEDIASGVPELELTEARRHGRCAGEGWRLRKNGDRFWASFVITAMSDEKGKHIGFAKVIRDLTERKRYEDALLAMDATLREERDRLHAATESSLDALFICEAFRDDSGEIEDFVFTYLNNNAVKLTLLPRGVLLGGKMCELLPLNRTGGFFERYKQVVLTGKPFVDEHELQRSNTSICWIRVQAVKLHDGVAITASDITARKRAEQRVMHLAQHDSLTGLPNRNLLNDRIDQSIARAKRDKTKVGVLLIDLDSFKEINDTLGHTIGDEVLCIVARRLQEAIRASDSIIRMGGDEFVAVVPDIHQLPELITVVDKIFDHLRPPIHCGPHKIRQTCSIGIAIYPESSTTTGELLKRADMAMYASKHAGKNQFKFFGHRNSVLKKRARGVSHPLPKAGRRPALSLPEA